MLRHRVHRDIVGIIARRRGNGPRTDREGTRTDHFVLLNEKSRSIHLRRNRCRLPSTEMTDAPPRHLPQPCRRPRDIYRTRPCFTRRVAPPWPPFCMLDVLSFLKEVPSPWIDCMRPCDFGYRPATISLPSFRSTDWPP
jgi:hypothetical protein